MEETIADEDVRSTERGLTRYLSLVGGSGDQGGGDVSALAFSLADLTSSLTQGVHPDPASKAWPQLMSVARQLNQALARDPPVPAGVDVTHHGRLKTALSNFLSRVQRSASEAGDKAATLRLISGLEEYGEDRPDGRKKVKTWRLGQGTGLKFAVVGAVMAAVASFLLYRCLWKE